jgi:hypothetical protein
MARTLGTDFQAQLDSSQLEPFYAVKIDFSPDSLRLWTGYHDITIGSEIYNPSGNLMGISEVTETSDISAEGIKITLSGLPSDILSEVLTETYQGVVVDVYFGVLETTSNATAVIGTPYKMFSGFIDTMSATDAGDSSVINISVENKLITLERAIDRRYTDQDQKNLFAGDKGLEFIDDIQNKAINWGGKD